MKFFLILPALNQQCLIINNKKYIKEIRMIKRIVYAKQTSLCCIMSTERVVSDLQDIILLYMDAMVEINGLLRNPRWMQDDEELNNNDNDVHPMEDLTGNGNEQITTAVWKKRQPNFVKSNSLGLFVADNTHSYHGPTTLNWEGGWHGERKIQQGKPLLHIKRSNAEWLTITLRRLYQHKTIQRLLDDCVKEEQDENQTSRQMEGALKVYGSRQMVEETIHYAQPITAVLDHKNLLYIPYRPIGRANTMRSSVDLMEIRCDDNEGTMIQNLCWVCPIYSMNNIISFESIYSIKSNFIITEEKLAGILSSHRLLPGAKLAGSLASPQQINLTCDDNDVAGCHFLLNENSTLIFGLTEAVIATNVSANQVLQSGTLLDEELPHIMEETVQELHSPIKILDEKVQTPFGVMEEEKTKHVGTPNVNAKTRSTKTKMDKMMETGDQDQV